MASFQSQEHTDNSQYVKHVSLSGLTGGYANEQAVQAYRSILSTMEEKLIMLQLNNINNVHDIPISRTQNLINDMKQIIKNDCQHSYVENDYIDISPDTGLCITYCEKCFSTFD